MTPFFPVLNIRFSLHFQEAIWYITFGGTVEGGFRSYDLLAMYPLNRMSDNYHCGCYCMIILMMMMMMMMMFMRIEN